LVSRKYCKEQARDLTDIAAACGQLRLQTKLSLTSANSALIARHSGGGLDVEACSRMELMGSAT